MSGDLSDVVEFVAAVLFCHHLQLFLASVFCVSGAVEFMQAIAVLFKKAKEVRRERRAQIVLIKQHLKSRRLRNCGRLEMQSSKNLKHDTTL